MTTTRRTRLSPASRSATPPTHVVTPAASSASLTTNSDAMKMIVGSPNPAKASPRSRTPVAHRATGTQRATTITGRRSHTKNATVAPSTIRVITAALTVLRPSLVRPRSPRCHR